MTFAHFEIHINVIRTFRFFKRCIWILNFGIFIIFDPNHSAEEARRGVKYGRTHKIHVMSATIIFYPFHG